MANNFYSEMREVQDAEVCELPDYLNEYLTMQGKLLYFHHLLILAQNIIRYFQ